MRIQFQRSGGVAGPAAMRSLDIDVSDLLPDEQRELRTLVNVATTPAQTAPPLSTPSQGRDEYTYALSISTDQGQTDYAGTMKEMPEPVRPLISWLEKTYRSLKPRSA